LGATVPGTIPMSRVPVTKAIWTTCRVFMDLSFCQRAYAVVGQTVPSVIRNSLPNMPPRQRNGKGIPQGGTASRTAHALQPQAHKKPLAPMGGTRGRHSLFDKRRSTSRAPRLDTQTPIKAPALADTAQYRILP